MDAPNWITESRRCKSCEGWFEALFRMQFYCEPCRSVAYRQSEMIYKSVIQTHLTQDPRINKNCPDCGILIWRTSQRCLKCSIATREPMKTQSCPDCGVTIRATYQRCGRCYKAYRRNGKR